VKLVNKPEWEAFDGKRFSSEDECRQYEADNIILRFAGLTPAQVEMAYNREDKDLAEAFEDIAKIIVRKRLDADERKRRTKPKGEAPPAPATQPENVSSTPFDE
jgi:hypothetical protein